MTRIALLILLGCQVAMAQVGPWPTAAKNGFGTSHTLSSKVWFTLADGVMTEVFYPTVDKPSLQGFQFLIIIPGAQTENEAGDTVHRRELPNPASLTFRQINRAKSGAYTIPKTYVTDPQRSSVLIRIDFTTEINAQLYMDWGPSGGKSALVSNCGLPKLERKQCTLAFGFGETIPKATATARASLARGFAAVMRDYELGWQKYVATLPRVEKHQRQFNMAAMVLKGLEDKTYRGAVIASPSTPWGGGQKLNQPPVSGYHAVWARDLYHVATAFAAIGDRATANRLLDYLFRVQQQPDGSFPQNSFVDGRPIGNGLQMDQVALPLVLAYQLQRNDRRTW